MSRTTRQKQILRLILASLFVLGMLVRFTALGFGEGVLTPRPDEELLRSGVLIALNGDLNPHYAVWGHLFHYLYSLVAAVWTCTLVLLGQQPSWQDAVASHHLNPMGIVWVGRALSALAGSLTILATYHLAVRALRDRLTALIASLFLSLQFLHVRDSHFATSDVLLGLLCTLSLCVILGQKDRWVLRAGFFTGLSLATKLLGMTLVATFGSVLAIQLISHQIVNRGIHRRGNSTASNPSFSSFTSNSVLYLGSTACVFLLCQPFFVLDPMETWYGMFGDLFNPERRPFDRGINLTNASIIVRYYTPQAIGWLMGFLVGVGFCALVVRIVRGQVSDRVRHGHLVVLVYCFWTLLALISVQQMFIRYLDPLLPVLSVIAAYGLVATIRTIRFQFIPVLSSRRVRAVMIVAAVICVIPNSIRCGRLLRLLRCEDTRALAGTWLDENLPDRALIYWSGYEMIESHLTMPWLLPAVECERDRIDARIARLADTSIDERILEIRQRTSARSYHINGLVVGATAKIETGVEAYPFWEHYYDLPVLSTIDRIGRRLHLLTRESPRWELMRRHICSVRSVPIEDLGGLRADAIALTGMPVKEEHIAALSETHEMRAMFDPDFDWSLYRGDVMYDLGDAWFVPNLGLSHVRRPGPQIMIFVPKRESLR